MLSENLKKKLIIESNRIVLKHSPILRCNFNDQVIENTVPIIQEINFHPRENIYTIGQEDNDIYFIEKGKIVIYLLNTMNNNKIPIKILSHGESFGER